jgi:hypothetical protein
MELRWQAASRKKIRLRKSLVDASINVYLEGKGKTVAEWSAM